MSAKKFISPEGDVFDSYQDYCNSPDLDPDLVVLKLWRGVRIPQNDYERVLLTDLEEMKQNGKCIEVDFN